MSFPLDEYRERTGLASEGLAGVDLLEAALRAQAYTIPFENFDVQLGRGISLDPDHLVDKLVRTKRGGYCFELNGLCLRALQALGFEARPALGRVRLGGQTTGRGHQISLVRIGGRDFIADVGLGGLCPRAPIPLEVGAESLQDGVLFRLSEDELGYLLQARQGDDWIDLYSFDLCPVVPMDIEYANHVTSTHPEAIFVNARIASIAHADGGRATLFNTHCTLQREGSEETETFPDDSGYLERLEARFGIVLDAGYESLKPL